MWCRPRQQSTEALSSKATESTGSSTRGHEFPIILKFRLNFWFGSVNLQSKFTDLACYSLIMASIVASLPPPLLAPGKSFTLLNTSQKLTGFPIASKFITRIEILISLICLPSELPALKLISVRPCLLLCFCLNFELNAWHIIRGWKGYFDATLKATSSWDLGFYD